jgi:protease IV
MTDEEELWERRVITRLAQASLKEQTRARRWSIFFKFLLFAYIAFVLFQFAEPNFKGAGLASRHTALIDLTGVIADNEDSSADNIISSLRSAFEDSKTAGVILRINSPGGTPVQAGYIYDEIIRLRKLYPDIPLYAVISDICASGGYYVASATDKIYADKASIVGSIGVRMDNFGFVGTIDKLGIERRTLTAGENKALMDPFLPVDTTQQQHLQTMLNNIHRQFIDAVKKGRGDRLKDDTRLFSGLIWTGEESLKLGLVDELGSAGYVAREVIGAEDIVEYTVTEDLFERLSSRVGTTMAHLLGEQFLSPKLN